MNVEEIVLLEGDKISLVPFDISHSNSDIDMLKKLQYKLCRSKGRDKAKVKENVDSNVLVHTVTETILIDDSDDEMDGTNAQKEPAIPHQENALPDLQSDVETKVERFTDDYEKGEPSGIVPPPRPPKTDPVSRVSHFASKNRFNRYDYSYSINQFQMLQ